jgi:hypothetical protein
LVIGTSNLDFSKDYGGIKWWMGPDETLGFVIGGVVSGGTHPSPVGDIGTVEFWRTDSLTTNEFVLLANQISEQHFSNTSDAITWLNGNGFWTSYDPLLITPTPSVTPPTTPLVTMTPTVTMTPSQTPAPAGIIDTYSNVVFGYSLRKISSSYSGAAVRVRRSSDNSEQDIGFLNGVLDTTTLTSFVGAGGGFITRWYDQVGTNRNLIQANAASQPRIYNAGQIELVNNKPAIFFDGSDDMMTAVFTPTIPNTAISMFEVFKLNDANEFAFGVINNYYGAAMSPISGYSSTVINGVPEEFVVSAKYKNSVLISATTRGQQFTTYNTNTQILFSQFMPPFPGNLTTFGISNYPAWPLRGHFQEVVVFASNQASNRTGIESNINTHYSIY